MLFFSILLVLSRISFGVLLQRMEFTRADVVAGTLDPAYAQTEGWRRAGLSLHHIHLFLKLAGRFTMISLGTFFFVLFLGS